MIKIGNTPDIVYYLQLSHCDCFGVGALVDALQHSQLSMKFPETWNIITQLVSILRVFPAIAAKSFNC